MTGKGTKRSLGAYPEHMAPSVPRVKTVARTAGRATARVAPLLRGPDPADPRPAWDGAGPGHDGRAHDGRAHDNWALAPAPGNRPALNLEQAAARGRNLTRRALGLGVLLLLTLLGAGVVAVVMVLLGVGLAAGSDVAGGLMVFTLLLALSGAWLAARRAGELLRPRLAPPAEGAPAQPEPDAEAALLQTLRAHEHHLPAQARAAFHATVIATRDALRATAADVQMNRDAFDARQAAREDLPELMDAYRAVPRDPRNDAQLLEQLRLIHTRMTHITRAHAARTGDKLAAHGHYLREKYTGK